MLKIAVCYNLGCLNKPCQDSRFCPSHKNIAMPFSNDIVDTNENAMMETEALRQNNNDEAEATNQEINDGSLELTKDGDLGVLEICGVKETRTSKLYQVL